MKTLFRFPLSPVYVHKMFPNKLLFLRCPLEAFIFKLSKSEIFETYERVVFICIVFIWVVAHVLRKSQICLLVLTSYKETGSEGCGLIKAVLHMSAT